MMKINCSSLCTVLVTGGIDQSSMGIVNNSDPLKLIERVRLCIKYSGLLFQPHLGPIKMAGWISISF